jgi:hypothetical protein
MRMIIRKLGALALGATLLFGALASSAAARPHYRVYFTYRRPVYYYDYYPRRHVYYPRR